LAEWAGKTFMERRHRAGFTKKRGKELGLFLTEWRFSEEEKGGLGNERS
jgi:hypothetical protein